MNQQDVDKLQKQAEMILAAEAEPGFYIQVNNGDPEVTVELRTIEGYFDRKPGWEQIKPLAQALRAGLTKRKYHVKGIKPAFVKDGVVYYCVIRPQ